MPTVEQVLYGTPSGQSRPRSSLLARSPGVSRECAVEIARLCEGWGKVPPEGVQRPVLLTFPLNSTLSSLRGRLFTVVRIARGVDPLFHAVILTESDYSDFDRNPFQVAAEGIFLDRWDDGLHIDRAEIAPVSLAPVVSPLPSEADVGLVDEVLRQVFTNHCLLLPLAAPDECSDRIMALALLALPLAIKRDLRFATWSTSEANDYTLAAVHTANARLPGWSRFLTNEVRGQLPPVNDRYVAQVCEALALGNVNGLTKLAATGRVDLNSSAESVMAPRPEVITAIAGPERSKRKAPGMTPVTAAATVRKGAAAATTRLRSRAPSPSRQVRRARRNIKQASRFQRWLVSIVGVAVLLIGASYLLNPSIVEWLSQRSEAFLRQGEDSVVEGVDVGAILVRLQEKWGTFTSGDGENTGAGALDELREQGAAPLRAAGNTFVAEVNQCETIVLEGNEAVVALQVQSRRGIKLERELLRLELCAYALSRGEDVSELVDLPGLELRERWDALSRRDPSGLTAVRDVLDLENLVTNVRRARRQASALADVLSLLDQNRKDADWTRRLESAAERLPTRAVTVVKQHREAALVLARLKRAEQAVGFERLAFSDDYATLRWLPGRVREAVGRNPSSPVRKQEIDGRPELLIATWRFYAGLHQLAALSASGTQDELLALIAELEKNPAVRFDPVTYSDHVDRTRLVLAEALVGRGVDPANLPDSFFPGSDRQAALDFMRRLGSPRTAETWQLLGDQQRQPFLARWARHAGERSARSRSGRLDSFDAALAEVVEIAERISSHAESGEAWGELVPELRPALTRSRALWPATGEARLGAGSYLQRLERAVTKPLAIVVTGATLRLEAFALTEGCDAVLELALESGTTLTSEPFRVGPSAPAGTGWVGACEMQWPLLLAPNVGLRAGVRVADGSRTLLTFEYRSLQDGEGVASLARSQRSDFGSVVFRLAMSAAWSSALPRRRSSFSTCPRCLEPDPSGCRPTNDDPRCPRPCGPADYAGRRLSGVSHPRRRLERGNVVPVGGCNLGAPVCVCLRS